jgi:arsenite methyltransferase
MSTPDVKEAVREKYGQAALRVKLGEGDPCCCGKGSTGSYDPITSNLYDVTQEDEVPDTAIKASLGCGNPTALAELKEGEIVLDLAQAVVWMFFFLLAVSAQPGKPTVLI